MKKKRKGFLFAATLLLLAVFAGLAQQKRRAAEIPHTRETYGLGTVIRLTYYGPQAPEALEDGLERLRHMEKLFSRHLEDSELYRVNRDSGSRLATPVSPELFSLVQRALFWAYHTEGAFDPTVGPLVDLWDITGENPQVPPQEAIDKTRALIDYRTVKIDGAESVIALPRSSQSLDLGAIAKGFAADELRRHAQSQGVQRGLIDLGGNILIFGSRPDGGLWRVGIQDPERRRGEILGVVSLSEGSVVTSGVYERFFVEEGQRYHHLLDPATGWPARTGLKSVSVISRNSADGDALSTALFVLGLERGLELLESLEGVEALFVTDRNEVFCSPGLKGQFQLRSEDYHDRTQ